MSLLPVEPPAEPPAELPAEPAEAIRPGFLLDGRVRYDQPHAGYRTGIEPVLLAAFVPARPGDAVLEAGSGAGAGLLCLHARVTGIIGVGVERDARLTRLATNNAAANGRAPPMLRFLAASIADAPLAALCPRAAGFDHAMANPPWHDRRATGSPDPGRASAKQAAPGLLLEWVAAMAAALRWRGSLNLVLPATLLAEALTALAAARIGSPQVLPLWPHAAEPARLLLLRGTKGGRAGTRLEPGLVLHEPDGRFTEAADQVLRGGDAIGGCRRG